MQLQVQVLRMGVGFRGQGFGALGLYKGFRVTLNPKPLNPKPLLEAFRGSGFGLEKGVGHSPIWQGVGEQEALKL